MLLNIYITNPYKSFNVYLSNITLCRGIQIYIRLYIWGLYHIIIRYKINKSRFLYQSKFS